MDDMQRFKQTYITECHELLSDMEARLICLNVEHPETEDLNAIFRCAHSIKGGAGAFGFHRISGFTHILEALLDAMREGKVQPSQHSVDTLLRSVDVLNQMVDAAQHGVELSEALGKDIIEELQNFASLAGVVTGQAAIKTDKAGNEPMATATYHIDFTPQRKLFMTGNEPLLILRELAELGTADIRCDSSALPPLSQIDPEQCYLRWDITLETDKGEKAIREVFEFVEDECKLTITALNAASTIPLPSAAPLTTPTEAKVRTEDDNATAKTQAQAQAQAGVTSIRVDIDKVDRLVNMVGELVITQAMLYAQTRHLSMDKYPELMNGIDALSQHTRELQEAVMAIRMQPVKSIFSRMPRIVRDLSRQLGKQIELVMAGENTEVDKTIIEQLSDPLTHMIRNSADHGVEMPEDRVGKGKPATGTIHLAAEHRGGKIVITITDDGNGINRERVLAKAREKLLVPFDAVLTDTEIDYLVFHPGFSTAEQVTNVSGRGVGMDVVKRNIEAMGGMVEIENRPGKGATFTVSLPLTLAILDGMIVRSGIECYIIPIANIIETLRPKQDEVRKVADGNEVINVRGEFIQVLYLGQLFSIKNSISEAHKALVVLVENGKEKYGLVVDELIGQQQVVIKSLEENSDPIEGISGATILGDGKVSLILDIAKLQSIATQFVMEKIECV